LTRFAIPRPRRSSPELSKAARERRRRSDEDRDRFLANEGSPSHRRESRDRLALEAAAGELVDSGAGITAWPRKRNQDPGLEVRAGRSDCWNAPENVERRAPANPVAQANAAQGYMLASFLRRSRFPDRRRARFRARELAERAARLAKASPTSDKLALSRARLTPLSCYPQ